MQSERILFPVDPMFEQPEGWLRASLPKLEAATRSIVELARQGEGDSILKDAGKIFQQQRWFDLTGVRPEDTHFSIVIPVHNEERSLPSFLGALFASEIPSTVDLQIVFVVNASSDRSSAQLKNRLAYLHPPIETNLPRSSYDPRRLDAACQVCRDGIRFLIVETPTAGKANALNIGNEIARGRAHEIAINIDANNWVEPDAIARLYGRAHQSILAAPGSNTVLVNTDEFAPTRNTHEQVKAREKTQKAEVTGWMFAWSTQWIYENDGFPRQAIDDYGTGLLALSQKKQIAASQANIWGFSVANTPDENAELIRFIYGAMQLAQRFRQEPVAMQILLEDFPHLRPPGERLKYYLDQKRKVKRPGNFFRGLLKWLFNELLIFKARQKLRRDPYGQTWDPIPSTK